MPPHPPPIAVCIPVRNEEAVLPALVAALERQRVAAALTICFFLDDCTDSSEALLRRAVVGSHHEVRIAASHLGVAPNAGRARRAAMAMGLERLGGAADALLFATDADSVPAVDWIAAGCLALEQADVAAGTLRRSEPHPGQTRIEAYYDRLHRFRRAIDPVAWDIGEGRHFSSGANLAIRASTYRAVGGFAELTHGEDATLLDEASRAGFRVRRDPAMVVETSSRRNGRAVGGFATALADLDRRGLPSVPHPAAAAWQYRQQARARAAFEAIGDASVRRLLGGTLGLTADHVLGVARDCPNAEAFAMRVVPSAPGGERLAPMAEAEAALALLELDVSGEAA